MFRNPHTPYKHINYSWYFVFHCFVRFETTFHFVRERANSMEGKYVKKNKRKLKCIRGRVREWERDDSDSSPIELEISNLSTHCYVLMLAYSSAQFPQTSTQCVALHILHYTFKLYTRVSRYPIEKWYWTTNGTHRSTRKTAEQKRKKKKINTYNSQHTIYTTYININSWVELYKSK